MKLESRSEIDPQKRTASASRASAHAREQDTATAHANAEKAHCKAVAGHNVSGNASDAEAHRQAAKEHAEAFWAARRRIAEGLP